MSRAPTFWWTETPTLPARLLRPLGDLYGAVTARRMARPGFTPPVPVICIGNLVAGGAGKTPAALAVAALLQARGGAPAFLTRGYGRHGSRAERRRVLRVDPLHHDAVTAGDEPLLLARTAPTYVSTDRRAAGERAVAEGATVLILDDGLQNPTLVKTLSIAVVDGAAGLGNGLCVPAGPLRAPVADQWPFVHVVCVIGAGRPGDAIAAAATARGVPVHRAELRPDPAVVTRLADSPLLAFAGIGRPEKFFSTLKDNGLAPRATRAFPDHHLFTASDRRVLVAEAKALGARLVTTAKDRARLPPDFPAAVLPVDLVFDDAAAIDQILARLGPA